MQKNLVIITLALLCGLLTQCTKDKQKDLMPSPSPAVPETDSALFAKATAMQGFRYYKGKDSIYPSAPASAHKAFFRVRFNQTAQAALTDDGKLPAGGIFPAGSIIVKELHANASGTGLLGYAIMEKSASDPNAAEQWVWAEYTSVTQARGISISGKGAECIGCHRDNASDYVRLFNVFP